MNAKAYIAENGVIPRKFFETFLAKNNIKTVFAMHEDAILEELLSEEPDMFFVQASIAEKIPGLIRQIKENEKLSGMFIILHASRAAGSAFAENIGADRFLPVPFSREQIDSILRKILNLSKNILFISSHLNPENEVNSVFKNAGFTAIFSDIIHGMNTALAVIPDGIIIDETIGTSGIKPNHSAELIKTLKATLSLDHIPVFVLSEDITSAHTEELLVAGACSVFTEPYFSDENIRQISEIVTPPKKGRKHTVLVIDDSTSVRNAIVKMFKELGFAVYSAEHGSAALELLKGQKVDIITTDYDMPVMNGWDFCRAVRSSAEFSEIPILMISTRGAEIDLQKGKVLGVAGYLSKPFRKEELSRHVHRILSEEKIKREKSAISKYVASDALKNVDDILEGVKSLEPETKFITILFSDICSFTPKCERHPPDIIIKMLNLYFDTMVKILTENNGIIDKFIGDAIVARFDSGDRYADAYNAGCAALAMLSALNGFDDVIQRVLGITETIQIRVGINSGDAILGNLGSSSARLDYTMIGDAVNTAQRLESKAQPMTALISDSTCNLLQNSITAEGPLSLSLKGKESIVRAWVLKTITDSCIRT